MNNVLYVDFIVGSNREFFNLNLISHVPIEVAGNPWSNTFEIKIDEYFFKFWKYVKSKYEVTITEQKKVSFEHNIPTKAVIEQKTRGMNQDKGYHWINSLMVSDDNTTETIIFYPYTLDLKSNILNEL